MPFSSADTSPNAPKIALTESAPCSSCGGQGTLTRGEKPGGFWESFHCSQCGYSEEEDGSPLYDALRQAIIDRDGAWALELTVPPTASLLKALRTVRGLSLSELQALRAQLPGTLRRGTKTEVEWEAKLLRQHGATDLLTFRIVPPLDGG